MIHIDDFFVLLYVHLFISAARIEWGETGGKKTYTEAKIFLFYCPLKLIWQVVKWGKCWDSQRYTRHTHSFWVCDVCKGRGWTPVLEDDEQKGKDLEHMYAQVRVCVQQASHMCGNMSSVFPCPWDTDRRVGLLSGNSDRKPRCWTVHLSQTLFSCRCSAFSKGCTVFWHLPSTGNIPVGHTCVCFPSHNAVLQP